MNYISEAATVTRKRNDCIDEGAEDGFRGAQKNGVAANRPGGGIRGRRDIQQTADGTQNISERITQVNAAVGETQTASGRVLSSSSQLSSQADLLRSEVDKFLSAVRAA